MTRVKIEKRVPFAQKAFLDRREAGLRLAEFMEAGHPDGDALVLALPRGGIPVAEYIAEAMEVPLLPLFVRKLPLPDRPEMGFGAEALDGTITLNEEMVRTFDITRSKIDEIARQVRSELARRAETYSDGVLPSDLQGRDVYLVDDGLATGYTMIAAAKMVRKRSPRSMKLCVPVSTAGSIRLIQHLFDHVWCLRVQEHSPFAVASFYREFADVEDGDVRAILKRRS